MRVLVCSLFASAALLAAPVAAHATAYSFTLNDQFVGSLGSVDVVLADLNTGVNTGGGLTATLSNGTGLASGVPEGTVLTQQFSFSTVTASGGTITDTNIDFVGGGYTLYLFSLTDVELSGSGFSIFNQDSSANNQVPVFSEVAAPEPASMALLGSALVGLTALRRRRVQTA